MARIRSIKPEFWTSSQIVNCSPIARLLFIGLWNFCDDAGIHSADPKRIKMEIFPGDAFTDADLSGWIDELIRAGVLGRYRVGREWFLCVISWHHQKIDKSTFRFPRPTNADELDDRSPSIHRRFDEDSPNGSRIVDETSPPETRRDETSRVDLSSTSVVGVVGLEETSPILVRESDRPALAEDFARIVSIVGVAKSPTQKAKDRELFFKAAVLSRHSLGSEWLEDALQSAGDKIRAGDINNKRALFFGICRQLATDLGKHFERELKRVQVPGWVNERKESPSDRETTNA